VKAILYHYPCQFLLRLYTFFMVDIETLLAVYGGKEALQKLLGPSLKSFGLEFKSFTEYALANLTNIFNKAIRNVGDEIESEGCIHPRVLKGVIQEGAFTDDDVSQEYFAGVLASSRTTNTMDDKGAYFISLLSRLTTFQIRSHYIFYTLFANLLKDCVFSPTNDRTMKQCRIYIPDESLHDALQPGCYLDEISSHIIYGLLREDLVYECVSGDQKHLRMGLELDYESITGGRSGFFVSPKSIGAELYLWAIGHGEIPPQYFFSQAYKIIGDTSIITIPTDAVVLHPDTTKVSKQKQ